MKDKGKKWKKNSNYCERIEEFSVIYALSNIIEIYIIISRNYIKCSRKIRLS